MKIQAKVELAGTLRRAKDGTLRKGNDLLIHPLSSGRDFGSGILRPAPTNGLRRENDEWEKERAQWVDDALKSEVYQRLMGEILEIQQKEPFWTSAQGCVFKDRVYFLYDCEGLTREEMSLLVQHFAISHRQQFKRISREIQAYENLERMTHREVIPESVRIFVWQRDQGKCVQCGRRDSLEFDHIIPIIEGGSSTERNVQLLCEQCNRRKGKNI
jgi:hypothetical protein